MAKAKSYSPTPNEIRTRAKVLLWMQEQKWDDNFITSVMIYDSPEIEVVWKMVEKYGAAIAYEKLMGFFE